MLCEQPLKCCALKLERCTGAGDLRSNFCPTSSVKVESGCRYIQQEEHASIGSL